MTLLTGLIIMMIVLFAIILIVLVAYIGPILKEFKLVVTNAREITDIAKKRVEMLDDLLDNFTSIFGAVKKASRFAEKINIWSDRKSKRKSKKTTQEDED